LQLLSKDNRA
jgi:hypothetical protein